MKRIVMFGGGSGSRGITMALCQHNFELTRVVPAWDSGGSSKALRESLGILAMGDIRQALMTLAHGENRVSSVVRFFNARLSELARPAELRAEFEFYVQGQHPLLGRMAPGIRDAVLNYLRVFAAQIDVDFDFRRGSIGNFVLTGAYFGHGRDINQAIRVFRKLCAIDGHVWPATTDDRVELNAVLRDASLVRGQAQVTTLNPDQARLGIDRVFLTRGGADDAPCWQPAANPAVLQAIQRADAIVFGPGSFYTSSLAHLSVAGLKEAIAATAPGAPKILIGNILECPETTGRTLADMLLALESSLGAHTLTHVFANRGWVPFERVLKGFRYLPLGLLSDASSPRVLTDDFEDPWTRGRHDAPKVAATLANLLTNN